MGEESDTGVFTEKHTHTHTQFEIKIFYFAKICTVLTVPWRQLDLFGGLN